MTFQVGNKMVDVWLREGEENPVSFIGTSYAGFPVVNCHVEDLATSPIGDMAWLYGWVRRFQARTIVECGVYRGSLTFVLAQALEDVGSDGMVWAVDAKPLDEFFQRLQDSGLGHRVRFIEGDTRDIHAEGRPEPPYDLVVLDSSHVYNCVMDELELYGTRLSAGGTLFLMDIAVDVGVRKASAEFRDANPELSYLRCPGNNGFDMFHRPFGQDAEDHFCHTDDPTGERIKL